MRISVVQGILRAVLASAGLAALFAANAWLALPTGPAFFWVGLGLLALTVVFPDTLAGLLFVADVLAWWLLGGAEQPWWQAGVVALLLGTVHLAGAWASLGPLQVAARDGAGRALVLRGVGFLAASAVGVAVVLGVVAVPGAVVPRGWGWVVVATAAVVAGTLLLGAARTRRDAGLD